MKKPQKKARKIVVDGNQFWYVVSSWCFLIWKPDGSKHVFFSDEVTGRSSDIIERGQWKKTTDGMVKPSEIASFIKRKFLK